MKTIKTLLLTAAISFQSIQGFAVETKNSNVELAKNKAIAELSMQTLASLIVLKNYENKIADIKNTELNSTYKKRRDLEGRLNTIAIGTIAVAEGISLATALGESSLKNNATAGLELTSNIIMPAIVVPAMLLASSSSSYANSSADSAETTAKKLADNANVNHMMNAQIAAAVHPVSVILNLSSEQNNKLMSAVKADVIKQLTETEFKNTTVQIDLLNLVLQNQIVKTSAIKAYNEIELNLKNAKLQNNEKFELADLYKLNLQEAKQTLSGLKEVDALKIYKTQDEQSSLKQSISRLERNIELAESLREILN